MEQNTSRRSRNRKRPQHPLITFLWALIVALVVLNVMLIIKMTVNPGSDSELVNSDLSSLDNISVEI